MAVNLKVYYHDETSDTALMRAGAIRVVSDKRIEIFRQLELSFQKLDFDFRNSRIGSGVSPNGLADGLYEFDVQADTLYAKVAVKVPVGTPLPGVNPERVEIRTFPEHVFVERALTIDPNSPVVRPSWIPGATWTYPEKQQIAVNSIKAMLEQKEADIVNAFRYLDLNPAIPTHVGYWWRAAVCVVKRFFQDPNTDPLIVAEMAKQAADGPTTRDERLILLRNLTSLISRYPTGPNFAAIWVETRNLNSPSDVRRKTLVQSLAANETYPLPSDFDSTDESWIVENQPGIVTYNNDSPTRGGNVVATLVDYDGNVSNASWQWEIEQNGSWSDASGKTTHTYSSIPAGTYRVKVTYSDNYGTGHVAYGKNLTVV